MKRAEVARLMEYADNSDFGGKLFEIAYEAAEVLHKNQSGILSVHQAAWVILYQAKCFDGSWSPEMLDEIVAFMKNATIDDWDSLPVKRAKKVRKPRLDEVEADYQDMRFSNVEI